MEMTAFQRKKWIILAIVSVLMIAPIVHQFGPPLLHFQPAPAPQEQPASTPLYASDTDGGAEQWGRVRGKAFVRNVTAPTISAFLPAAENATGTAVVILPGGSFRILEIENEGWDVAKWFADQGVAAFVVKYRTKPSDKNHFLFARSLYWGLKNFSRATSNEADPGFQPATDDTLAALRFVRANAARWNIDPERVGVLGFSAGGSAARDAARTRNVDERPDFIGVVYANMGAVDAPPDAPPLFAAIAIDDPFFTDDTGLVDAWRSAGRPAAYHAYESGGHGFGLGKPGTQSAEMPSQFLAWLNEIGYLGE